MPYADPADLKRWRRENAEHRRAYQAAYNDEHRDQVREANRQRNARWRARNPEAARAVQRRYDSSDRGRAMRAMRVRLRRQGHSPEALEYADVLLADPCSYCGGRADTVDHIVALARNGAHEADNLTAACRSCNSRKRTRPLLEALLCVAFR